MFDRIEVMQRKLGGMLPYRTWKIKPDSQARLTGGKRDYPTTHCKACFVISSDARNLYMPMTTAFKIPHAPSLAQDLWDGGRAEDHRKKPVLVDCRDSLWNTPLHDAFLFRAPESAGWFSRPSPTRLRRKGRRPASGV